MAQITFTIPDAALSRVLDAIAAHKGYANNHLPSETKAQFAKRMVKETVKRWAVEGEVSAGGNTIRLSAETDINIQD